MALVKSTFKNDDCIFLLKDLTDIIEEVTIEEKEALIAQGVNYSEMISKEYPLSEEINNIFLETLHMNAHELAQNVATISEATLNKYGKDVILVSLARAGSPIGALMRRYLQYAHNMTVPHYSISIIRGKGIDENAINTIFDKYPNGKLAFIDGWTGKGSITFELRKAIAKYNSEHGTDIDDGLIVIADPARKSAIYGTRKDICIPNACLNSTVSGLVSRTIHNTDLISDTDYHGAKLFEDLAQYDFTNDFLDIIEKEFNNTISEIRDMEAPDEGYVDEVITAIAREFGEDDITRIKLSIGESSRALLRRKPKVLLVKDINNPHLKFVLHLAKEKGVEIKEYDTYGYECIAVLAPKGKMKQ